MQQGISAGVDDSCCGSRDGQIHSATNRDTAGREVPAVGSNCPRNVQGTLRIVCADADPGRARMRNWLGPVEANKLEGLE